MLLLVGYGRPLENNYSRFKYSYYDYYCIKHFLKNPITTVAHVGSKLGTLLSLSLALLLEETLKYRCLCWSSCGKVEHSQQQS